MASKTKKTWRRRDKRDEKILKRRHRATRKRQRRGVAKSKLLA